ncbi:MAG TPA: hypothetical protein VJV79_39495 [Polyangiaceae bacterium]|nr:hypothetical protein [Polyangiaceae bacterium]
MRLLCGPLLFLALGCASTVTRLDGEFPAPIGPARDSCEQAEWLVAAPTRVQFIERSGQRSTPRDDGVALYKVGAKHPEAIPPLADSLRGELPSFDRRVEQVRSYDTRTWTAAGLGAAGLIAIGVGTALFVSAFKTDPVTGTSTTNGTQAGVGGAVVLTGFGLGIAGLAVNPGQAQRSQSEAARYAFLPPKESREQVVTWTQSYNQAVRARCARGAAP